MSNTGSFFLDFLKPFFKGIISIFEAIFKGLFQMFNVVDYIKIIREHKEELTGAKIMLVILAVLCLLVLLGLLIYAIIRIVKRVIRIKRKSHEQDLLMDEVEKLNYENIKLKKENEKYLAMANGEVNENGEIVPKEGEEKDETSERFYRLSKIDEEWKDYVPEPTNTTIKLNELCEQFRNYSANKLGLYYNIDLIRLFISAFASNRLIILQGISGTGKTSLAYAMGSFINNDSVIAPVQPSWRDRAELFGYFNEFTKKFNETELLAKMYEASYNDKIYIAILDEMNIARVEYYFAEMLSIMEMPSYDEWVIDLVPNPWPSDPKKLVNGKFRIPKNMWYVGTINNDDSTFMVTDKVYDRALPISIDEKAEEFKAPDTDKVNIKCEYLLKLFDEAQKANPMSEDVLSKLTTMDDYVIKHFRISFGNRILQQMKNFVPVFVACGGQEIVAVDYLICHKILRKFEQLNMSYIRNEVDGFIEFLNQTFGQDVMKECTRYLLELKKNA